MGKRVKAERGGHTERKDQEQAAEGQASAGTKWQGVSETRGGGGAGQTRPAAEAAASSLQTWTGLQGKTWPEGPL